MSRCSLPDTAGSSKSPFSPHLFVPRGSHSSPVLGAGGRREGPFYLFFLPSPFILLQALIIEGLNLSCSCLLPSFPDSIPNKGLWFEFEGVFFFRFLFPSRDLRPVMRYQHPLLPTAPKTNPPPRQPLPLQRLQHPLACSQGREGTRYQRRAAGPCSPSWEVNTIELQGRAACNCLRFDEATFHYLPLPQVLPQ